MLDVCDAPRAVRAQLCVISIFYFFDAGIPAPALLSSNTQYVYEPHEVLFCAQDKQHLRFSSVRKINNILSFFPVEGGGGWG